MQSELMNLFVDFKLIQYVSQVFIFYLGTYLVMICCLRGTLVNPKGVRDKCAMQAELAWEVKLVEGKG